MVRSGTDFKKSEVRTVEFCDLEKHQGELVKTKLIYTGFEEYWGASGYSDCTLNQKVELNFQDYYDSWRHILIEGQLNKLHNNYWNRKAEMTVIGLFEVDTLNGFGHLNTNKAQILVKSVRMNVQKK